MATAGRSVNVLCLAGNSYKFGIDLASRVVLLSSVLYAEARNPGEGLEDSLTVRCIVGGTSRRYLISKVIYLSNQAICVGRRCKFGRLWKPWSAAQYAGSLSNLSPAATGIFGKVPGAHNSSLSLSERRDWPKTSAWLVVSSSTSARSSWAPSPCGLPGKAASPFGMKWNSNASICERGSLSVSKGRNFGRIRYSQPTSFPCVLPRRILSGKEKYEFAYTYDLLPLPM